MSYIQNELHLISTLFIQKLTSCLNNFQPIASCSSHPKGYAACLNRKIWKFPQKLFWLTWYIFLEFFAETFLTKPNVLRIIRRVIWWRICPWNRIIIVRQFFSYSRKTSIFLVKKRQIFKLSFLMFSKSKTILSGTKRCTFIRATLPSKHFWPQL